MTTMTPNETSPDQAVEAVAVTQADREAALALHLHTRSLLPGDYRYDEAGKAFRLGARDHWRSVQAFARHRLSTTPPPADHTDLIARLDKVYNALTPGAIDNADLDGMAFTVADAMTALQAHASPPSPAGEVEERVARAICKAANPTGDPDKLFAAGNPIGEYAEYPEWMLWLPEARTALELG